MDWRGTVAAVTAARSLGSPEVRADVKLRTAQLNGPLDVRMIDRRGRIQPHLGVLVVFLLLPWFHLLRMDASNYPEFWQCIGMIVGGYGIGYRATP